MRKMCETNATTLRDVLGELSTIAQSSGNHPRDERERGMEHDPQHQGKGANGVEGVKAVIA